MGLRGEMIVAVVLLCGTLSAAEPVDFEQTIAPLLASKCWKCHGAAGGEGGVSLTNRSAAMKKAESGQSPIVPGDVASSAVLRRVMSADANERMPPTGPALGSKEIAALKQWIAEGAVWPEHWAYRPLMFKPLPLVVVPGLTNPIDVEIAAAHAHRGLTFNPEADRRTLMRRLTIDLWGLHPAVEEVDAFVADARSDAYERLVDRLLADPRYGERQARIWMDLVHFAETHGHDQDRPREQAWPYRDYLIQAFNADLPYAEFLQQQIAGDVLFPGDPWGLVATGFLAAGPWDESSLRDIRDDTLDRQIARVIDRDDIVTTAFSTFASTTIHCARCHDHKFDPISQADYYAVQAVFAATGKGVRKFDFDPAVSARRRDLTQRLAELPQRERNADEALWTTADAAGISDWIGAMDAAARAWQPVSIVNVESEQGATLQKLDDGAILSTGTRPEKDTYRVVFTPGEPTIAGLELTALSDAALPQRGPGRQDNGNLHLSEVVLWKVRGEQAEKLPFAAAVADFNQVGWTIDRALDGNAATAWGIYPRVGEQHRAVFRLTTPVTLQPDESLRVELQQLHGGGHLIGKFRLATTAQPEPAAIPAVTMSASVQRAITMPATERSPNDRATLAAAFWTERWQRELQALPPQQGVYSGSARFEPDGGFGPFRDPPVIHVLHRGDVTQPRETIGPGTLSMLPGLPSRFETVGNDDGARRATLARWLADPANGLTWRSIVNRLWQQHFGRGLVETPNDFGHLGSAPSHPTLLDRLALELQHRNGSLKALHRLMVTSRTYRQSSAVRPDAAAVDGENRSFWRMHRSRLEAEPLRDSLLVLSGQFNDQMGGPSVRQFVQTPGVHVTPTVDYLSFQANAPAHQRRSVYRFLFRTIPDPFMEALDCPDSSQLTPQRNESLTATQALATLNDQVLALHLAEFATAVATMAPSLDDQVTLLFRRVMLRSPSDGERQLLIPYAAQHGLANLARVLVNSNEFNFVD